ncbi:MAG: hypothetical protein HYY13_10650 [Nitrospirae bacterium]|nr:hypothetical protein [Nitrospirota bacterium]
MAIDIGTEGVEDDGRELVLTGRVKAPVNWAYVIGMQKTCWDDFFSIALSPRMAGYMATPKRLGLFVKLTAFVGLFLVTYPFALMSTLWSNGRRGSTVSSESPSDSGRFMALVAAGRRSSAAAEEEIEEDEAES